MNGILAHYVVSTVAVMVLASASVAQDLQVPPSAAVGAEITVSYTNQAKAFQIVQVDVFDHNGTKVDVLEMELDAEGRGSTSWTVLPTGGMGFEFLTEDAGTAMFVEPAQT